MDDADPGWDAVRAITEPGIASGIENRRRFHRTSDGSDFLPVLDPIRLG